MSESLPFVLSTVVKKVPIGNDKSKLILLAPHHARATTFMVENETPLFLLSFVFNFCVELGIIGKKRIAVDRLVCLPPP